MKETRTINLNGLVYNIDHDAYQVFRDYLNDIEIRLPIEEKSDVMSDLEARISELFQRSLFARNIQVVDMALVESVMAQIGSPAEFGANKRPKVKKSAKQNSGCGRVFGITVLVLIALMSLPVLIPLFAAVVAVIMAMFGVSVGLIGSAPLLGIELFGGNSVYMALFITLGLSVIVIPVVMIICTIVSYMRTRRGPKARFWWITLVLWILSLVGLGTMVAKSLNDVDTLTSFFNSIDQWDDMSDDMELFSEQRDVPAFHSLQVKGATEVDIHIAPIQQLMVKSSILSDVITEVRDSVLYVSVPSARYSAVELDITVPELRSIYGTGACKIDTEDRLVLPSLLIECSGASKMDIDMSVQSLCVNSTGASYIELEGSADEADIKLCGAGEIDAVHLLTQSMHINCSGASKAEVNVSKELWAQASGASKIVYVGNPVVQQNMSVGGSRIVRKKSSK